MIYLDNAATTAPDREAVEAALKFLETDFYNPSALYRGGFSAHRAVEEARKNILSLIAPQGGYELVFTSSGSEADVQECVQRGMCKVNFATELRAAYTDAVKKLLEEKPDTFDPKKFGAAGMEAVKEQVMLRMKMCGCDGKAS